MSPRPLGCLFCLPPRPLGCLFCWSPRTVFRLPVLFVSPSRIYLGCLFCLSPRPLGCLFCLSPRTVFRLPVLFLFVGLLQPSVLVAPWGKTLPRERDEVVQGFPCLGSGSVHLQELNSLPHVSACLHRHQYNDTNTNQDTSTMTPVQTKTPVH